MPTLGQQAGERVLIVGAGPTGLVLALWLTHLGVSVRIIDKTIEPGTTSRALGVHARTLEFYRQLGLADEVVAEGIRAAGVNLWVAGAKAARLPISQMGEGQTAFPYVLIYPQDAHEKLLVRKLEASGVCVERSTELLRFDQDDRRVRAWIRGPSGADEALEVSYLAGCDGASSTVRQSLTTQFPGGTYSHLFYVADVEASGPPTDNEIHVDLEEAEFLGIFPLTQRGRVRVIGTVNDALSGRGHTLTFDDVRGDALGRMRLDVPRENWFSTYRVHHRVARQFREGRVFLLGDAAHLHSPVGAQGMNTGIGDAVNLSWKLAAVLRGDAPEAVLESYEIERRAFATRLVATTDRAFSFVTSRGALSKLLRTRFVPFLLPRIVAVNRLRRFMFRTLSQIGIRYRESPLSAGRAGGVHGGDRLPWVMTPSGKDNHASLARLVWSVHVYGDIPAGIQDACEVLELPLHLCAWQPEMRNAGLVQGATYLLRPDGYVALAADRDASGRLHSYFAERFLRPGRPCEPLPRQHAGATG